MAVAANTFLGDTIPGGNTLPKGCVFPAGNKLIGGERGSFWLPPELVCMIISHVDDFNTILSCSKTCRLWRAEAFPHLRYYSLTTHMGEKDPEKSRWPESLLELHKLSLLRYVKQLSILRPGAELTLGKFGGERNLRPFSVLTNLRELRIDCLQLSSFIPNIERYFGRFSSTLQSLALFKPAASSLQVLYFVGLFQNLRDLKLLDFEPTGEDETAADPALIPLFRPPLDGWLTLRYCQGGELVDGMIALYGGLRFRCVYLCDVQGTERVLHECAETLETLRVEPGWGADVLGLLHNSGFDDLMLHGSLWTLKLSARFLPTDDDQDRVKDLKLLLSGIISHSFDLVIIYNREDFSPQCALRPPDHLGCLKCDLNRGKLKALGKALERNLKLYKVNIRPVLCAEVLPEDVRCHGAQATVEFITTALQFHVEEDRRGESAGSLLPSNLSITSTIYFSEGYDKTIGI